MEFIRFGLLIIITIAAISIAVRHDGSHHGVRNAAGSGTPSSSASPTAPSPTTTGGSSGAGGSSGTGTQAGTRQGNGGAIGANGGGTTATTPALPRTGTQAAELGGLAALMIAAGSFSVTVSRRTSR